MGTGAGVVARTVAPGWRGGLLAGALLLLLLLWQRSVQANCDLLGAPCTTAAGVDAAATENRKLDLPPVMPDLPIREMDVPATLLPRTYARVLVPDAPVYGSPADESNGVPPKRLLGIGVGQAFVYLTIDKLENYNGIDYYRINQNEWVRAEILGQVTPSRWGGVFVDGGLVRPLAFVVRNFHPRLSPGGPENLSVARLERYDIRQVFAHVQHSDGYIWYLVGPDQWVEQRNLGLVTTHPRPDGVTDDRWIEINLYEQTMAVYENGEVIFATLVSSGLPQWYTRPGVFQVYAKRPQTYMSGAYAADKTDYYALEEVPWTMFFDKDIALHGAYWHNGFGFKKSHGCVNLSPADAQWLFGWAEVGTWVWVHDPSGETPSD